MSDITIYVVSIGRQGHNGDRAISTDAYKDYEIHVVKVGGDICPETKVHTVLGYDRFNSHILNKADIRDEAESYARRLAKTLGDGTLVELGDTHNVTSYRVSASYAIYAKDQEEALQKFQDLFGHKEKLKYQVTPGG